MKLTSLIKPLIAVIALPTAAFAADLIWEDGTSGSPLWTLNKNWGGGSFWNGWTDTYGPEFGGVFDITGDGFNASTMTITKAKAAFYLADDGDSDSSYREYVDIFLGDTSDPYNLDNSLTNRVVNNEEFDGNHSDPWDSYYKIEVDLDADLIAALQGDGLLSYLIKLDTSSDLYKNSKPDGYVKVVQLVAEGYLNPTTPPPSSVPDAGATALLCVLGMAGVAGLRKRMK